MTAGEWMVMGLAQAAAAPDTVVAVQARPAWIGWVEVVSALASIVIAVALLVIGFGLLFAALQARKAVKQLKEVAERLRGDVQPIVGHVTGVADNVHYVSTAVRADVTELRQLVTGTTRRLNDAAAAVEGRMREFDALLGVVQTEAEDLFVSAASTVRGVRAGADSLRAGLEDLRAERDGLDDDERDDETLDGYDGPPDPFGDDAFGFGLGDEEDEDALDDPDDDGRDPLPPLRRRPPR